MAGPVDIFAELNTRLATDPITREARERFVPNMSEDSFISFIYIALPWLPNQVRRHSLEGLASAIPNASQTSYSNVATARTDSEDVLRLENVDMVVRSIEIDENDDIDNDRDELLDDEQMGGTNICKRTDTSELWPSTIRVFKHQKASENTSSHNQPHRISKAYRTAPREDRIAKTHSGQVLLSEWFLWVPDHAAGWKAFSNFPESLRTSLQAKVSKDYKCNKSRHTLYQRTIRNKAKPNYDGACLNHRIFRTGSQDSPPTWNKSSQVQNTSCDQCTKQGRLCARVVMVNGVYKIGIYPLPGKYRGEYTPADMSYWIRNVRNRRHAPQASLDVGTSTDNLD